MLGLWLKSFKTFDNAPILGEYIKAFLTKKVMMAFFLNRAYLARFMEASEAKRKDLPGHAYFKKIWNLHNAPAYGIPEERLH